LFNGPLRRQLILAVATVHAVMMALLVWDLVSREQNVVLAQQIEKARAVTYSMAVSSAGWVLARDVVGLEEIVDAQRRFPELSFAMICDVHGKVLAHTDKARIQQDVTDLPATPVETTLSQNPALVDVAVPVMLGQKHVGWARIGLGHDRMIAQIAAITRNGIFYILGAVLAGSILAALMASRITRRLYRVKSVADMVRAGNYAQRVDVGGDDELTAVGAGLNTMLDELQRHATELKASNEEIRTLAFYDPLTQLPNRRLLHDRLQRSRNSRSAISHHGALLFIDLDNFKNLNDTLGHDVGDMLLQECAHRLQLCIREADTVARLGGDEFVIILDELAEQPDEAAMQAETVGNKVIDELNRIYDVAGHELRSSPSIGVVIFRGHELENDELLKRADMAMYQSKAAGRNTLRFFDPAMQATVNARSEMENALLAAIQNNEFELFYQPQVDGQDQAIGAEALIRWRHPQRGMVSPAEFIPVAEESGLIVPIGHWVLREACQRLAIWANQPETAHLVLAVNVSARQFRMPTIVQELKDLITYTGIDPSRLKLELTEGLLLDNIDDAIDKMKQLRTLGVSLALDDFGTGYSSLNYLKKLPLDQLKIDQSFVRDLLDNPEDETICRAIIALGNSLGLAVIAEGVETEAQRQFLLKQHCLLAQGYLYSRPLPENEFRDWLIRRQPRATEKVGYGGTAV
jgi:diguanylate cyclase (GGDEF)-like protein